MSGATLEWTRETQAMRAVESCARVALGAARQERAALSVATHSEAWRRAGGRGRGRTWG